MKGLYSLTIADEQIIPKSRRLKMKNVKPITTVKYLRHCITKEQQLFIRSKPDEMLKMPSKQKIVRKLNRDIIREQREQIKKLSEDLENANGELKELRSLKEKIIISRSALEMNKSHAMEDVDIAEEKTTEIQYHKKGPARKNTNSSHQPNLSKLKPEKSSSTLGKETNKPGSSESCSNIPKPPSPLPRWVLGLF